MKTKLLLLTAFHDQLLRAGQRTPAVHTYRGARDIENVEIVFKDGVGYDSEKLIQSVQGLVGIR
ncbi:MAG TPA: hypothetical protein VFR78_20665 [Pyrinomonadaceae bacterium]|nr:hypothetical protein [Pyrinomonadaceae bacterium]